MVADMDFWFLRKPTCIRRKIVDFRGTSKEVEIYDFLDTSEQHYADSFGTQWAKYRNVQIDRYNGTNISYRHLEMFTQGDINALRDKTILEIGSGAGRFTDHLVDIGNTVITVDPTAIFSNAALGVPNLIPVRADLFDVPVNRERVDVVFCRGVTQHTVSTRRAIKRLFDYVKPGGLVLFDVYHFKWFTPFVTKYWVRPFVRNIPAQKFIPLAEKWVPRLLRFKSNYVVPVLPKNKLGINIANQIVPIADYTRVAALRSPQAQIEWSVLDTVDMYTPRYDRPMTWSGIMRTLSEVGARRIRGNRGSFCFRAEAPL